MVPAQPALMLNSREDQETNIYEGRASLGRSLEINHELTGRCAALQDVPGVSRRGQVFRRDLSSQWTK